MTTASATIVDQITDMLDTRGAEYEVYEGYSGRGMCGRESPFAIRMSQWYNPRSDTGQKLTNFGLRCDNLGTGWIWYFSGKTLPPPREAFDGADLDVVTVSMIDSDDAEPVTMTLAELRDANDPGSVDDTIEWALKAQDGETERFFGYVGTWYDVTRVGGAS